MEVSNVRVYYKLKEIYREKYFKLTNDSKIAYMLLKNRFDYSVKNNWVDEEDNIYFIFTVSELMRFLRCREGKVSKIKRELEEVGLLKQKKGRIHEENGHIKSTPNLLYLGKPQVTTEDVFQIVEEEQNQATVFAEIADNLFYSSNNSLDTNRHRKRPATRSIIAR
ncbi:hypothetical protein IGK16_003008 [Enterococcus pernyi]